MIIGIDPGLEGGIAGLDEAGHVFFTIVMPTVRMEKSDGGERGAIDEAKFRELMWSFRGTKSHVFLEKQHAVFQQSAGSAFTTGDGYGVLRGVLVGLQVPFEVITATQWQKVMLAGLPGAKVEKKGKAKKKTKASGSSAPLACGRLWPCVSLLATRRSSVPHTGLADALLIAEYGRRLLSGKAGSDAVPLE